VKKNNPDMLKEYDFGKGIRGKHYKRCAEGSNAVVIDAELAKIFPDSKSVNKALQLLVDIAKKCTNFKYK
jgi:hypothetical protein